MIRINAIFPENMLKELDSIARERKESRSMLLREAAERLIKEYIREKEERRRKERIKKAINTQDRLREKSGKWNGVSELRKWRESGK